MIRKQPEHLKVSFSVSRSQIAECVGNRNFRHGRHSSRNRALGQNLLFMISADCSRSQALESSSISLHEGEAAARLAVRPWTGRWRRARCPEGLFVLSRSRTSQHWIIVQPRLRSRRSLCYHALLRFVIFLFELMFDIYISVCTCMAI